MSFSIIPSDKFKKEAKRLIKKFPSLKQELSDLSNILSEQPFTGTDLGSNIYKIRLTFKSKGKGKRSGARVISYTVTVDKIVYLLTIYDKSELDTIDDKNIKKIIQSLNFKEL